uniref:Uncharacterized protein n=1 Tax=Glossina pallidipes TaxID=7398 RepID=A0A1A9ZKQ7_GLOPL
MTTSQNENKLNNNSNSNSKCLEKSNASREDLKRKPHSLNVNESNNTDAIAIAVAVAVTITVAVAVAVAVASYNPNSSDNARHWILCITPATADIPRSNKYFMNCKLLPAVRAVLPRANQGASEPKEGVERFQMSHELSLSSVETYTLLPKVLAFGRYEREKKVLCTTSTQKEHFLNLVQRAHINSHMKFVIYCLLKNVLDNFIKLFGTKAKLGYEMRRLDSQAVFNKEANFAVHSEITCKRFA